jgi:transcriptional regulator with XRE-family HTH domain
MDLKEVLATNLRRERHAQKLTQEELADRAGLQPIRF